MSARAASLRPAMDVRFEELCESIERRRARIAVVGLGSVGLPLAHAFVAAGHTVVGYDVDAERVAQVRRGENPLHHFRAGLVRDALVTGRFEATDDARSLSCVDVAIVCVPTPLSPAREPDLSCVTAAATMLAARVRPGTLVVLESTTHPGTTRDVLGAIFRAHGKESGSDVWLAYSPEREDPGRAGVTTATIPKLVGGTCARSGDLAQRLYESAIERVRRVSSAEVAESAKLLENVFRAANIALVNEAKIAFDALGIDVWEVIEAASTKPFGFMKFTPGPGMGGQCIPVDPHYLSWAAQRAGVSTPLIELAGEVNRAMPRYVVTRIASELGQRDRALAGARVLVLGIAYKPDVDTVTESPALRLIELLESAGACVEYHDPLVRTLRASCEHTLGARASIELSPEALAAFDAVVVTTDHACIDYDLVAAHARLVVDTRHALASRMQGRTSYATA